MVKGGRHAAQRSGFGRSAGNAALRGAGLLAVALVLGIVLLQSADGGGQFSAVSSGDDSPATTVTTAPAAATTTTTVPLRPPGEIKVLAANGTTTKGLAGRFKDRLTAAGYNALAPTDTTKKPVEVTTVYFAEGFEAESRVLAEALGIEVSEVKAMPAAAPVRSLQGANILLVVGRDKAASTTPTTRAGAAATTTAPTG